MQLFLFNFQRQMLLTTQEFQVEINMIALCQILSIFGESNQYCSREKLTFIRCCYVFPLLVRLKIDADIFHNNENNNSDWYEDRKKKQLFLLCEEVI